MYVSGNPKSKAAIKRAIAAGETVRLVSNSPFDTVPENGTAVIEGPWYPVPHKWWGTATVKDGRIVKVV
jgi:hypothetical protein